MDIIQHVEAYDGFGSIGFEDVQLLMKALEANESITDIDGASGMAALQLQSLEGTLVMLTAQEKHLTLWRDIPKTGAKSTLEEYSAQVGWGQDESGWVGQMENPLEADAEAVRKYSFIKFQRQMWKVPSISGLVQTITPAEKLQKQAASMRCLRNLNAALYSSDSEMIPESIDGFEKTIWNNGSSYHVIDLRGQAPEMNDFRNAAELIFSNFGTVEGAGLYMSPGALTCIDGIMEPNVRVQQGQIGRDGGLEIGYGTTGIKTSYGRIIPKVDIFIAGEYEGRKVPKRPNPTNKEVLIEGKTSPRAPEKPSLAVTTQGATVSGSKWIASGVRPANAIYGYRVASGNRFGRSIACAEQKSSAVAAGGSNTLTITPSGESTYPATYHEIYSQQEVGGEYYFLARVKDSGTATTTYVDKNTFIPGTSRMFLLDLSSVGEMRTFMLKRLADMHSQEYGPIGPYRWGTVNLYATPQYYAPKRFVLFINVPVGIQSKSNLLWV